MRAAIEEANALAGPDRITFSVAGTIAPATAYDLISQKVEIDGTSAPAYAGAPTIDIRGPEGVIEFNFVDGSAGSDIRGLKIHGFGAAIIADTSEITIAKNHLGPIGGGTPSVEMSMERETSLRATTFRGVSVLGGSNHVISDNYIGLDADGTTPLPNQFFGVGILAGNGTRIGGSSPETFNVITANGTDGIRGGTGTSEFSSVALLAMTAFLAAAALLKLR